MNLDGPQISLRWPQSLSPWPRWPTFFCFGIDAVSAGVHLYSADPSGCAYFEVRFGDGPGLNALSKGGRNAEFSASISVEAALFVNIATLTAALGR